MNGLNPTWLFHQSTLFSINCGSHAAIYFFSFLVLLTVERLVKIGVPVVKGLVLEGAEAIVHPIVHLHAKIVGALLEAVGVVTPRVEITDSVQIVVVNVTIRVKTTGVEKSAILRVITTVVPVHVVVVALINAVTAKVTVPTVVLVPPTQDFKYN